MTEYELVDAIASYNEQGMSSVLAYFTVCSGYLVAAYLAGKAMTRSQVFIVSVLFSTIALLVIYSAAGSYKRSVFFWTDLLVLSVDLHLKLTQDLHLNLTHPGRQIMA